MKTDIKKELFDLKITINKARYNLMFIIILTIINIVFIIFKGTTIIPFSCSIATYATAFAMENSLLPVGLTIAALILLPLLICYFKSKDNALFIVAPVGILVVDSLALVIISIISGAIISVSFLFDFIFHIISIFYLIKAGKAYKSLGDFNAIPDEIISETIDDSDDEDLNYDDDEDVESTEPISEYNDDGTEPLLKGDYKGLHVFAVIRNGTAELVINNYVCDSLEVTYFTEFELKAIVNNINFSFQYNQDHHSETMFLYADDTLLDSVNNL